MANKHLLEKLVAPITFIAIGAVARILPHAPNFAPIAAMALFGGTYMTKKQAFALPIVAMVLSDLAIGFDNTYMRLTVYGSFLIMVLIGIWLKKNLKPINIVASSLASSLLFFITTNFAVWGAGNMYPKTAAGLLQAYFLAIPFFRNTILGDLFYVGSFFGTYYLLQNFLHRKAFAEKT
jgi:hypothetical protein